mgnify:CR=1 FL=1
MISRRTGQTWSAVAGSVWVLLASPLLLPPRTKSPLAADFDTAACARLSHLFELKQLHMRLRLQHARVGIVRILTKRAFRLEQIG